jgi:hypothetical protein
VTRSADPPCDAAWYTPAHLPDEVAALDASVQGGLAVCAPGKVGLLERTLAPHAGITRVERQYQRAPLHVYRPIYLDPHRPGMAFVFVQQSGDGFVQLTATASMSSARLARRSTSRRKQPRRSSRRGRISPLS